MAAQHPSTQGFYNHNSDKQQHHLPLLADIYCVYLVYVRLNQQVHDIGLLGGRRDHDLLSVWSIPR